MHCQVKLNSLFLHISWWYSWNSFCSLIKPSFHHLTFSIFFYPKSFIFLPHFYFISNVNEINCNVSGLHVTSLLVLVLKKCVFFVWKKVKREICLFDQIESVFTRSLRSKLVKNFVRFSVSFFLASWLFFSKRFFIFKLLVLYTCFFSEFWKSNSVFCQFWCFKVSFIWDLIGFFLGVSIMRHLKIEKTRWLDYQFSKELFLVCNHMIDINY